MKHFRVMPPEKLLRRRILDSGQVLDHLSLKAQQPFFDTTFTTYVFRNMNHVFPIDGKCSPVEEAMVHDTECDTIRLDIRPIDLPPFDMSGFNGNRDTADFHIESAHCTSLTIGFQNT